MNEQYCPLTSLIKLSLTMYCFPASLDLFADDPLCFVCSILRRKRGCMIILTRPVASRYVDLLGFSVQNKWRRLLCSLLQQGCCHDYFNLNC